ncbi:hypothetical protein N657DRAFT_684892 [Parathielavia appendiculata]|uniref:DUF4419 domain-containing protein n=1 Tax=Parathielavia appendiculata TaxID=2587402 RepID=A0AAN6TQQ4_9PEZI|nr:hypothetical protein N657DRAFT_684892 [Parathielavia appendiculata]
MNLLSALALAGLATASVVILPGGTPKPLVLPAKPVTATDYVSILRNSAASEFPNSTVQIILSTYDGTLEANGAKTANASDIFPSSDSFVRGAIQAWGEHLHLEIRPDEVWFTILTQLNFYMEAHAESVRDVFVRHAGQETILVEDLTWTAVLWRFKEEIQKRVKTPWLLDWIVPNFSTTTADDVMTANILMMGLMKAYFKYEGAIICGLPSVTLLGEKEDWEKLLARLGRLTEFGAEPDEYRARLEPILRRFVRSFDEPDSNEIQNFWSQIVFAESPMMCGAAPLELSGWITGFLFWSVEGERLKEFGRGGPTSLVLDKVSYGWHDIRKLPVGYAKAPFTMHDFGNMERFPAYVAAGTLGKRMVSGPPAGYAAALKRAGKDTSLATNTSAHGTIRPLSAWMLYGPLYPPGPDPAHPYDDELRLIGSRALGNLGSPVVLWSDEAEELKP